ncbi:MAG: preprotein translocase subunit YajC [Ignavibacteria bacterium]|nr:preprotein translocase subunit YajC [Bacteroidota bacterium]MSQ46066.1 preprotein translocase subunit YajC [Ignavibacteria bacterium]
MDKIILLAPPQSGQGGGEIWSTLLMFSMIILIFYFMILRPQNKKQKEKEKLISSIKKGDKVITAGGIHGEIAGTDEKTVLLEIADKVKVKIEKSSIVVVNKAGEVTQA